MSENDWPDSRLASVGIIVHGVARGVAVVVLALALYVALTNWEGDGSVWALRYTVIALAVYFAGRAARYLLAGR